MTVTIASDLLAEIGAAADRSPGAEVCGLLFGDTTAITGMRACTNVAPDPARRFEIDPAALLAAHRAARAGGPRIVGHYHSHPTGDPTPSRRDAGDAVPDGSLWLIAGGGAVRAWRAVPNGAVHGRFDPVALRVIA